MPLQSTAETLVLEPGNDTGDVGVQTRVTPVSREHTERRSDHSPVVEGSGHVAAGVREGDEEVGSDQATGSDPPDLVGHGEHRVHLVEGTELT
jgi:hypothetical protein